MKSLKVLSLFSALLFIGINSSFSQSKAENLTEEQKEELAISIEEYFSALDLSEEQKSEFETITKKYAERLKAVKDGGGYKLQKYMKVKSIRKSKNAEMKKLLSKHQYKVYLEKQEEMQEKLKEKRKKNN